jgi:thiol-disulfide isomerase/thioredoxin
VALASLAILLLLGLSLPVAAATGEPAPDFSLPGRGETVSLASLRGKVVYVDFWASWCGPCRKSFPWMNRMQSRYADQGLAIVAVNLDKSRELSDEFLKETPANFRVAYDPEGKAASAYRVKGMPSSYLIDREGRIRSSHIGFREENSASMEAAIQALVQQR